MIICYIANSASIHTVKWVNHFSSLGYEVHVISHSPDKIDGAVVHYIDYNIKNFIFKSHQVHALIKRINPDILHAHQANTCGLYAATMRGYKYVVSAWGSDILIVPEISPILKFIVKYVLKKSEYITSDSMTMTEKIIELGGRRDRIYTFPMGIEKDLLDFKHEFNNNEDLNIISVRRLEKLYNIDIIINGFALALKEAANIHLTVAATGNEYNRLIKLADELCIKDKITFTGEYKKEDLGPMLREQDVFISIPESDSTSVSLLECMGCGIYPVLSNVESNKEWVTNGKNGIILDDANELAVRDAILWCYQNKEKIKAQSEGNINIIKERALWTNNAKIIEKLYKEIIIQNHRQGV